LISPEALHQSSFEIVDFKPNTTSQNEFVKGGLLVLSKTGYGSTIAESGANLQLVATT